MPYDGLAIDAYGVPITTDDTVVPISIDDNVPYDDGTNDVYF